MDILCMWVMDDVNFFFSKDGSWDHFCWVWILQFALSMWRYKWRECAQLDDFVDVRVPTWGVKTNQKRKKETLSCFSNYDNHCFHFHADHLTLKVEIHRHMPQTTQCLYFLHSSKRKWACSLRNCPVPKITVSGLNFALNKLPIFDSVDSCQWMCVRIRTELWLSMCCGCGAWLQLLTSSIILIGHWTILCIAYIRIEAYGLDGVGMYRSLWTERELCYIPLALSNQEGGTKDIPTCLDQWVRRKRHYVHLCYYALALPGKGKIRCWAASENENQHKTIFIKDTNLGKKSKIYTDILTVMPKLTHPFVLIKR